MPNTFGDSSASYVLLDPEDVLQARDYFRREPIPELALANSFSLPSGCWPARGWLLLRLADYAKINPYSTSLFLQIDDFFNGPTTFGNLTVVQARCVTRGIAADSESVYLVEVTDRRGVVSAPWFRFPTTSQYNVLSPAYPGEYYTATLNAGTPWTWDGMVGNLWGQMTAIIGAYPGLPFTPAGTPTNWSFPGISCWDALCRVLDLLGCTIAPGTSYTIVQVGGTDTSFTTLTTTHAASILDDLEYIDTGSGRVPGSVTVYFHRINQYYGTEETVRRDSLQWQTTPLYSVTVAAPAAFSAAAGQHAIWNDFAVRYDVDGAPLAADVATANTIAAERVTEYYDRVYRGTLGYMRRMYPGALAFTPGAQVDGVRWCYRDRGWVTEIVRGPQPPFEELKR